MKKILVISLLALQSGSAFSQVTLLREHMHVNNLALLNMWLGGYFYGFNESCAFVGPPELPNTATTFAPRNVKAGLWASSTWLGAFGPNGQVLFSGNKYAPAADLAYVAGPLDENGEASESDAPNWERFWTVDGYQLRQLRSDWADNGALDAPPSPDILAWPGKGNPYFEVQNGFVLPDFAPVLAPFFRCRRRRSLRSFQRRLPPARLV